MNDNTNRLLIFIIIYTQYIYSSTDDATDDKLVYNDLYRSQYVTITCIK